MLRDTLTVGSLFSGVGGLELGLEMTGRFKTVWQVEQNEYCRKVLAKHWPGATRFEDVRNVGRENLAPVDVICGGFPCQDVSHANPSGNGLDGERSGLWFEYARIVSELRPDFIVVENVAALLNDGLDRVLGSLAGLGYDAEWQVLHACAQGASHPRARVFVLAHAQRPRLQGFIPNHRLPCGAETTHALTRHATPHRWLALDSDSAGIRARDGIPPKLDRLRLHALGNAVVPQCARVIGERLLDIHDEISRQGAA